MSDEKDVVVGGWKINPNLEACDLPQPLATGFSKTLGELKGADYVPVLYCGSQLVRGMNYMIICEQTLVLKEPQKNLVQVVLNEFQDVWEIVSIDEII